MNRFLCAPCETLIVHKCSHVRNIIIRAHLRIRNSLAEIITFPRVSKIKGNQVFGSTAWHNFPVHLFFSECLELSQRKEQSYGHGQKARILLNRNPPWICAWFDCENVWVSNKKGRFGKKNLTFLYILCQACMKIAKTTYFLKISKVVSGKINAHLCLSNLG